MLLLVEYAHDAADKIYRAIVASTPASRRCCPILQPYDTVGSTRYVDFDTTRPVYVTDPDKCHISHVVADTDSWEQKMAQALEEMDEVVCYVKNHNLGFTIPYTLRRRGAQLHPRLHLSRIDGRRDGEDDLLNLIIEVSRRGPTGEGRQGGDGAQPLGAGGQQPRRLRPLGVPRDHRPVGCQEHDPGVARSARRPRRKRDEVDMAYKDDTIADDGRIALNRTYFLPAIQREFVWEPGRRWSCSSTRSCGAIRSARFSIGS